MSKVEDALKKLKSDPSGPLPAGSTRRPSAQAPAAVPSAGRKKVILEGEKYHVDLDELVRSGLLAPQEQARTVADEFRKIKRPLIDNAWKEQPDADQHMNVIMLASSLPRAGKTFCAVNLAVSISLERELNVLLVDGDVQKPHISRAFGLQDAPGLIDLLLDDSVALDEMLVRTDINDIQVLPAGRGHAQATELLASERMSNIVRELSIRYPDRVIILDSPPLLNTSEAQALASQVGQIVLVVEAGQTSEQILLQTLDTLDPDKALNLVLNKARHWGRADHYYGGGYGYYGQEAT